MFDSIRIPVGVRSHIRWLAIFSSATNLLALAVPLHILQVYSRVLKSGSLATLFYLTSIIVVMLLVAAYADFARRRIARRMANKYLLEEHPNLIRSLAYESDTSIKSRKVVGDMRTVSGFIANRTFIGLFDLPFSLLFLLALFALSFWLGVVASLGLATMLMLARFNNRATSDLQSTSDRRESDAFSFATATLRDTDEIRAMGLAEPIQQRWKLKLLEAFEANDESAAKTAAYSVAGSFVRQVILVSMVSVGAILVLSGLLSGGVVFAATMITNRLLSPVDRTIGNWNSIMRTYEAHGRLSEMAETAIADNGRTALDRPKGRVDAKEIFFAPDPSRPTRLVLAGMSISVLPGRIAVIVGEPGSGKTTVARILAGAQNPNAGSVELDGTNRSDWNKEAWGRAVGYVAQNIKLSPVSVSENITRLEYDFDSGRLLGASKKARAHEMISSLPKGYATVLERGLVFLSDKQTLKIALARALYGDPSFLVLDEPDTDLDREDQKELIEILKSLRQAGVAILVVSRRSRMRAAADEVYELKSGRLERIGEKPSPSMSEPPGPEYDADDDDDAARPDLQDNHQPAARKDQTVAARSSRPVSDLDDIRATINRIVAEHRQVM